MIELKNKIETLLNKMKIGDFNIEINEDFNRLNIFINEDNIIKKNLPNLVSNFNHLSQLIAKKLKIELKSVDINNYRLERERLITELAKAAARKALMTKQSVSLPVMNGYERRLIHMELAMRPDIKTESIGEGKARHVTVSPLEE